MISTKNKASPVNSAGVDLGLGDVLQDQVKTQIDERRKKLMQAAGATQGPGETAPGIFNPQGISAAAQALGIGAR